MKASTLFALMLMYTLCPDYTDARQLITVRPSLLRARNIARWHLDGSGTWRINAGKLILSKAGTPSGPIRRPAALAILKTIPLRHASVEAEIRSTASPDVVRRDLDIIVGYESPSRFYYVHLAGVSDNVHNGIFLVNNADRVRIDSGTAQPQLTDFAWHRVRVERDGRSGRIAVYMDGSRIPALQAIDTAIVRGRVGFGSFDDTGEFRNIKIDGSAD